MSNVTLEPWRYVETSPETCGQWEFWQIRGFNFAQRIDHRSPDSPDKMEILCSDGGRMVLCRTVRGAAYRDQEWSYFVSIEGRTYPVTLAADHLFLEAKITVYLMALDGDPEAVALEGRPPEVPDERAA